MRKSFLSSLSAVLLVGLVVLACGGKEETPGKEGGAAFQIQSTAFEEGGAIPVKHTCDGDDVSPPLSWSGAPKGTESFVVICDDPEAPAGTWVHWILFNIPGNAKGLAEGVPEGPTMVNGARHGTNDWDKMGYGGPCPPPGSTHTYHFRIFALDEMLVLEAGAAKDKVLEMMEGHVLAQEELTGIYGRPEEAAEERMEEEAVDTGE